MGVSDLSEDWIKYGSDVVFAVFILLINLRVISMTIQDRQKSPYQFRIISIVCFALGALFIAAGLHFRDTTFDLGGRNCVTLGTIIIISIAIYLFVLSYEIEMPKGNKEGFAKKLEACFTWGSRTIIAILILLGVIVLIIAGQYALALWLVLALVVAGCVILLVRKFCDCCSSKKKRSSCIQKAEGQTSAKESNIPYNHDEQRRIAIAQMRMTCQTLAFSIFSVAFAFALPILIPNTGWTIWVSIAVLFISGIIVMKFSRQIAIYDLDSELNKSLASTDISNKESTPSSTTEKWSPTSLLAVGLVALSLALVLKLQERKGSDKKAGIEFDSEPWLRG